ncbi:NUDIX hydrolase [Rhizobium sp. RM]|uniref:NUDIX hydrolase n=1 Tax=Rhizobium sp. RM TaxID=2748079 RepID=UPI00110D85A3|nr:NUDIX hydrolase [Rhizobium sp. RM]NWJ25355.1 NUDIX hydrolase [Rhizobium sp. RM]TMV17559.1 NUDIX hydrolase [Rhizobium sp. Td3]
MGFRRNVDWMFANCRSARKICQQAAAACCHFTPAGELQVLLITSRDTGRWILPKGNIHRSEPAHRAARREATEEAGIRGKVLKKPIGFYSYNKDGEREFMVSVHLLRVKGEYDLYPEIGQRKRSWVRPLDAARLVNEPELSEILILLSQLEKLALQNADIADFSL